MRTRTSRLRTALRLAALSPRSISFAAARGVMRAVDQKHHSIVMRKRSAPWSGVPNSRHQTGKSASAKNAWASAAMMIGRTMATAVTAVSDDPAPTRRSACLNLAKACLIGFISVE
jgi:hypothetical protein